MWDAYNGVGFLANALGKGNELKDIYVSISSRAEKLVLTLYPFD